MKKKETASSASSWASFKEDIPKKINVGEVWSNKMQLPPKKGRQLEAANKGKVEAATDPGATLMGRLASRMTARNLIDNVTLGPKAKSTHAKRAQVADSEDQELASGTHPSIHEPRSGKKVAPSVPTVGDDYPTKLFLGAGLHEQTKDDKASNFSNPIPEGKKAPGSNMLDQAMHCGNIVEDKEFGKKMKAVRNK